MAIKINIKSILDHEASEIILNLKSQKGYSLVKFSEYSLTFKKTGNKPQIHQLIYLDKTEYDTQDDVVQLFKDTGWDYVNQTSLNKIRCLVFRSESSQGLEAYTDTESVNQMEMLIMSRLFKRRELFLMMLILFGYLLNFIEGKPIRTILWLPLDILLILTILYDGINRSRLYIKYNRHLRANV